MAQTQMVGETTIRNAFREMMSEIYPLADKFDLSPRLKQNGEGKTG